MLLRNGLGVGQLWVRVAGTLPHLAFAAGQSAEPSTHQLHGEHAHRLAQTHMHAQGVCVRARKHAHMHVHACTHAQLRTHRRMSMHMHMHAHEGTCTQAHMHAEARKLGFTKFFSVVSDAHPYLSLHPMLHHRFYAAGVHMGSARLRWGS
jgi:hypothetical protein